MKNSKHGILIPKFLALIMRVMYLLFFIGVLHTYAMDTYAQVTQLSIHENGIELKELFNQIEEQTDFYFFYNNDLIDKDMKVEVDVENKSITEVLDHVLKNTGITYQVNNKAIVLNLAPSAVQQQGRQISGIVFDEFGDPIIGANIVEKGTTNGVITDFDGNFSLTVSDNSVLVVSYIGYTPQEIVVKNQTNLRITLKEDSQALEEVVVVGYGVQKKANMTGSVSQVDSKDLANRPIQNISSGIQGLMPGVTVVSGEGRPGQDGSTIRIRGVGTLNTADPYILVDGIETGSMNSVDPNDIESISVLKDAASAAIYGSKASNGVILITTKRGQTGKPRINYSGYVGFQKATQTIDRMGSHEYATYLNQALVDNGKSPRFTDEEIQKFKDGTDPNYPDTDWYDLAYKTGVQHTHNVNISGGTEDVKYMASVGYLHQTGILPNAKREQFNGRTNLDMKLTPKLTVRMNMAYIKNDYSDPTASYGGTGSDQIVRQLNVIAPWVVPRYDDGTYGTISDGSPIAWLDNKQTVDRDNQNFSGILAADYQIIDGLKATVTGAYISNSQHYRDFQKFIQYNPNKASEPNHLDERHYEWNRATFDALLNYDKQFGMHGLKALAGWHTEKYNYAENRAYRRNFPNNDLTDLNAGDAASQTNEGYTRELAMISWFGRVNYDYAGKYLLEANIRADASSRFADGHRWGYFPSFSGAWRLSEEEFMENLDWLSNLKIRASWGQLGNQDALKDYYPWMSSYDLDATYPYGGSLNSGYYQKSYKMSTISWEKSRTWGLGLDLTINNKINAVIDYYDRKTTGIIMDVAVPAEFALEAYKDNVGEMVNRGVEVMLSYNNKWGDWSFGAIGNFAYNKNEIQDLGGVDWMSDPDNSNMRRAVGQPINAYYIYKAKGYFQSDDEAQAWMDKYQGQPGYPFGSRAFKAGDLIYQDTNGDGKVTEDDRVYCNSTNPAFTYGLNLNAGYKGFDLSLIFNGAAKVARLYTNEVFGDFKGDNSHPSTIWRKAWTPENRNAKMPRIADDVSSPSHQSNVTSTFWLQNTSYLRLKNVQLGYTIPKSCLAAMGIENIRVYYSAENVFTIDKMPVNLDPESKIERGSAYPLIRTHSFGVNISF